MLDFFSLPSFGNGLVSGFLYMNQAAARVEIVMIGRLSSLLLIAALATVPGAPVSAAPQARYLAGPTDAHLVACHHYQNRARFKPRAGDIEFVTLMAEACQATLTSLYRPEPQLHAATRSFLNRLVELNEVIRAMNATRVFGSENRMIPATGNSRLAKLPKASNAGEFLIAHRLGLMAAMDDWIENGGEFALAEY